MADSFNFELVSPERLLLSATATEVVIPGTDGEMTVMAHHSPTMTTIKPGVVTVVTAEGQTERYVVFGGFADILPEGCTLLAESAVAVAISTATIFPSGFRTRAKTWRMPPMMRSGRRRRNISII
jgi:F-type H+-transporting ATPase subunit epsilon